MPSFEKMTAEEIRAFYRAWYKPNNATLIVAGDIDPQRTLAQIRREFDGIAAGPVPERSPIAVPQLAASAFTADVDYPIGFGVLAYRAPGVDSPDYAASQVLEGAFMSGRGAFADLSAERKVLGAAVIGNAFPEVGASFFLAIPVAGSTPEAAQKLVAGVLAGYRANGVPADLVDAAKTRLLGQQAYRESSITGLAIAWAQSAATRQQSPDAVYDAIARVTRRRREPRAADVRVARA